MSTLPYSSSSPISLSANTTATAAEVAEVAAVVSSASKPTSQPRRRQHQHRRSPSSPTESAISIPIQELCDQYDGKKKSADANGMAGYSDQSPRHDTLLYWKRKCGQLENALSTTTAEMHELEAAIQATSTTIMSAQRQLSEKDRLLDEVWSSILATYSFVLLSSLFSLSPHRLSLCLSIST
jgi:hypothetical protein